MFTKYSFNLVIKKLLGMSRAETSFARQIFAENFGGIEAQVADFIMAHGPQTLSMIRRGCQIKLSQVRRVQNC